MMNNKAYQRYLPALLAGALLVGIGMASTIVPWMATPRERVYTGLNGYSNDYFQYVSYIKEGMYGRLTMVFRSFPFPQPTTPIHAFYIVTGMAAARFGIEAPVAFHLLRIILGLVYVFLTHQLFLRVFAQPVAFLGTILAFISSPLGWLRFAGNHWEVARLSFFNFSIVHPERVTDRPHYLFGAVMVLTILLLLTREKTRRQVSKFALAVLAFGAAMVHASAGILLLVIGSIRLHFFSLALGSGLALGITYFFVRQYTLVPEIWLDSYIYSGPLTIEGLAGDIVSFGPTLWLGLVGLLWASYRKETSHGHVHAIVLTWLLVQLGLFFFGYRLFHADRVRFLQSLYFIPMAYGTVLFFQCISARIKRNLTTIGVLAMIVVSLPVYTQDLAWSMIRLTDYKTFNVFAFPTIAQREAYAFLDSSTPRESIVLAGLEAGNNILIYSHSRVIGNEQGWSQAKGKQMLTERDEFFRGKQSADDAWGYLRRNAVAYVYYGYQERAMGNASGYAFLTPVFANAQVRIYRVEYPAQ